MKFTFAAALIAAIAFAEGEDAKPADEADKDQGMGFFTTTEDGLEIVAFPPIPGVDINYVTKDTVMGFLEDMKAKEAALDEAERKNF